jgi:hypothetical protein
VSVVQLSHTTMAMLVGPCDITGSRRKVKFKQLDVYPRTTGTQSGTQSGTPTHDRVKKLVGKVLDGYYRNSQPGKEERVNNKRGQKRPRT